ncbi:hypothetical protein K438DRAFT_1989199 [Mycena galopus ATCC 62051]|nr:hypothetical protein K438DRAFT_1989199 [Mycena galopus ATCC 62051]
MYLVHNTTPTPPLGRALELPSNSFKYFYAASLSYYGTSVPHPAASHTNSLKPVMGISILYICATASRLACTPVGRDSTLPALGCWCARPRTRSSCVGISLLDHISLPAAADVLALHKLSHSSYGKKWICPEHLKENKRRKQHSRQQHRKTHIFIKSKGKCLVYLFRLLASLPLCCFLLVLEEDLGPARYVLFVLALLLLLHVLLSMSHEPYGNTPSLGALREGRLEWQQLVGIWHQQAEETEAQHGPTQPLSCSRVQLGRGVERSKPI